MNRNGTKQPTEPKNLGHQTLHAAPTCCAERPGHKSKETPTAEYRRRGSEQENSCNPNNSSIQSIVQNMIPIMLLR
jgi:hypothetical protein